MSNEISIKVMYPCSLAASFLDQALWLPRGGVPQSLCNIYNFWTLQGNALIRSHFVMGWVQRNPEVEGKGLINSSPLGTVHILDL